MEVTANLTIIKIKITKNSFMVEKISNFHSV